MAPLKFGSSSKTSTFKRSAFPMQTGTANHTAAVQRASALKATDDYKQSDLEREQNKTKAQQDKENLERDQAKAIDKKGYEQYKTDMEDKGIEPDSMEDWAASNKKNKTLPSQVSKQNVKKTKIAEEEKKKNEEIEKNKKIKEEEANKKKIKESKTSNKTNKLKKKVKKQESKSDHSKLTEKITQGKSQLETINKQIEALDPNSETYDKDKAKLEKNRDKLNNNLRNYNEEIQTASKTTKKGDKAKEKLAESLMYDDMSIEERLAYKQKKRDARDKRIRNTIAEIDSIIPASYGGGRGVSNVQEDDDKTLTNQGKMAGDDPTEKPDYMAEASGGIDTSEDTGILDQEAVVDNLTTDEQTDINKKKENKNVKDGTNTDDDSSDVKTTRYKDNDDDE